MARWTLAGGLVPYLPGIRLPANGRVGLGDLAFDARGRPAVALANVSDSDPIADQVLLIDPAGGAPRVVAGKGSTLFEGRGIDDGLNWPLSPAFDAYGNLLFVDYRNRQVKRIPKERL